MKKFLTDIDMGNNNIKNVGNMYTKTQIDRMFGNLENEKDKIEFSTHYEFPNIGQENVLYIAKDEGRSYIWNTKTNTYQIMNNDAFDTIQCTL